MTEGWNEALLPILETLPTIVFSLEEQLHKAAAKLRNLRRQQAVMKMPDRWSVGITAAQMEEGYAREHGRIRLIEPEEILAQAPETTCRRKNPLGWQVEVEANDGERHRFGVIPDKFFGLHYLDKPEGRNRAYFCLESDRATMPVMRANLQQTSFYRKFMAYYATRYAGLHTKLYNIKNFRVLTVTSSADRVRNLIQATQAATNGKGSRMFLFADEGTLQAANPLTHTWMDGIYQQQVLGL